MTTTIASYLKHLSGSLNWAHRHGYIDEPIWVEMPRQVNNGERMKGRPITGEELDHWLDAVDSVLPKEEAAKELKQLIKGLWFSGGCGLGRHSS